MAIGSERRSGWMAAAGAVPMVIGMLGWCGPAGAVELGSALVRLSAADAVVEPAERWSPGSPGVSAESRRYRSARKGQTCYLLVPRFWQGARPSGMYVVTIEYRDTVGSPAVVMIYDGGFESWGHYPMGTIGGRADREWKTARFMVPAEHIAVKDRESVGLYFSLLEEDVPIGTISVFSPGAGQEQELRRLFYEDLQRSVEQATERMGKNLAFEEKTPLEPVSKEHRKLGFVPFVRSWLKPVYPNSVPTEAERQNRLEAFAAAGEAEPVLFGLRNLDRELSGVRVVCADLAAEGGKKIGAKALEVGVVEFAPIRWGQGSASRDWRVHPVRIWPVERYPGSRYAGKGETGLTVPAETTLCFWLTIRVPADAAAGVYAGPVTVTAGSKSVAFELKLRVLPFRLVENRTWWIGQYISGPLDDRQCQDLAEHGVNATSQWPGGYEMRYAEGKWQFDFRQQDTYMKRLQQHGITGPHVWFQGNDRNHRLDLNVCSAAGVELDSPEFFRRYVEVAKEIHEHAKQAGWNRLIWCIFDEPGKGGRAQERWLGDAKALKEAMKDDVTLFCVILSQGAEKAREFLPYADIFSCNGRVSEVVGLAREQGKQVWSYAGVNQRSEAAVVRWSYGFGVWKSGVQGHYSWAYNWYLGMPWNDFDGDHMDWMVSYADVDGALIPTPGWEAFREGTEDLRYLLVLQGLLEAKKGSEKAKEIGGKLERLRAALEGAEAAPDTTGVDVLGLEFVPADQSALSRARAQIASWIIQLQE